jgi:hypothetical protein
MGGEGKKGWRWTSIGIKDFFVYFYGGLVWLKYEVGSCSIGSSTKCNGLVALWITIPAFEVFDFGEGERKI